MAGGYGDSVLDITHPIDDASAHQFNSIRGFLRFKKGPNSSSGYLQTSIVSYGYRYPGFILPSLQVDLVSSVHYADRDYFTALKNELGSYDCVLFETVTLRENLDDGRRSTALKRLTGSQSRGFYISGCVVGLMARIVRLGYQGDCLDYQTENWFHADLDEETFQLLKCGKGESIFKFARDVAERSMITGAWGSKLVWAFHVLSTPFVGLLWASHALPASLVALFVIGSDWNVGSQAEFPELEALYSLDFGAALKLYLAKLLTSESRQTSYDVEDSERNKAAIDALKSAMDEGHNKIGHNKIASHMADIGRRLQEELGLFPSQVQWLTAWSIGKTSTKTTSFPFLARMAQVSGWRLNRHRMLALLTLVLSRALHVWLWKLAFGTIASFMYRIGILASAHMV